MIVKFLNKARKNPHIKVASVYLLLSVLWIIFSDRLVMEMGSNLMEIRNMQLFKGLFFVIATSSIIYFMVRKDYNIKEQQQAKLEKSEQLFRSIFEQSTVGKLITNKDGAFTPNAAFANMLGYTEAEFAEMDMLEVTHPDDRSSTLEMFNELLEKKEGSWRTEKRYLHKSGTEVWADVETTLICDSQAKPLFFATSAVDITAKKIAEKALIDNETLLQQQNEELQLLNEELTENNDRIRQINQELYLAKEMAEESDRLKTSFLANMSHEIRTPLNGIMGFSELLQHSDITEDELNRYLDMLRKSSERMLNTINDLIEMATIESEQQRVHQNQFDVRESMAYFYKLYKPMADQKGIALEWKNGSEERSCPVQTDKAKFESIVSNLLRNAIKFTFSGSVVYGFELKNNQLHFSVTDTGIGIAPDKQIAIFDRFVQADDAYNRPYEGSGLGLSIVKAYAGMLKGNISLDSTPGVGSTFRFDFPVAATELAPEVKTAKEIAVGAKATENLILVVEDDETSFTILELMLKRYQFKLLWAKNGEEALRIFKENNDLALILMDLKLPGMDGFEVTRLIREHNSTIPIIAQTAYALTGDASKAIDSGCNDYIAKPIRKQELLRKIETLMS